MKYAEMGGLRLSRLTLGTVQLGLEYGIANRTGRPDPSAAQAILRRAAEAGVNTFDTAPAYGRSEGIVGAFLATKDAPFAEPPVIVTKLPEVGEHGESEYRAIFDQVRASVVRSAERLGLAQIPVLLLHHAADMTRLGGLVTRSLARLRAEGLVGQIGVSVYSPAEVDTLLDLGAFDAIQIPVNLFDHRLLDGGQLERLAEAGVAVLARSVFLQGLFFLEPDEAPPHVAMAAEPLRRLRELSDELGRPVAELAVAFVRDLPGITSLVIGVETLEQLESNLRLIECPPLPADARAAVRERFAGLPVALVDPSTWDRRDSPVHPE